MALGLVVVLMGSIAILAGWMMTNQRPGWWRQIDPTDPRVVEAAEDVENELVNELHRADRPSPPEMSLPADTRWASEPWAFALPASGANAWLNTRLKQWLENRVDGFEWPEEIREVQVEFDDDSVVIGLRVQRGESGSQVLAARFGPQVREDGSLWVQAERVYVGRLPVPAGWVLDEADERLTSMLSESVDDNEDLERLLAALSGERALMQVPLVELGDGRRVRLLAIKADRGLLTVTCRTEAE
mgnify:CR=1 FL=1